MKIELENSRVVHPAPPPAPVYCSDSVPIVAWEKKDNLKQNCNSSDVDPSGLVPASQAGQCIKPGPESRTTQHIGNVSPHRRTTSLHLHSYHFLVLHITKANLLFIKLKFYLTFLGKLHYKKLELQLLVGIKKYV